MDMKTHTISLEPVGFFGKFRNKWDLEMFIKMITSVYQQFIASEG